MPTPISPPLAMPVSEKITLAAGVDKVIPGGIAPISIMIPTGTTADVYVTCAPARDVNADMTAVDWIEWTPGSHAGPYLGVISQPVTAIKLTSAGGGTVDVVRTPR